MRVSVFGNDLLCRPILVLIVALIALLNPVATVTKEEASILQDFKPLGMDESVKIVKKGDAIPLSSASPNKPVPALPTELLPGIDTFSSDLRGSPPDPLVAEPPKLPEDDPIDIIPGRGETDKEDRVDAFDYTKEHKDSQQLWLVPKKEGKHLTRLITSKEAPTFLDTKVVKPTITTTQGNGTHLASYTIMVPIWIPAVKPKKRILEVPPPMVKYVKETHTEMVPVTKTVSLKKTIIKPQRVPQKIVTDYVREPEGGMSSRVDDQLNPNEEILGSVVTNFQ